MKKREGTFSNMFSVVILRLAGVMAELINQNEPTPVRKFLLNVQWGVRYFIRATPLLCAQKCTYISMSIVKKTKLNMKIHTWNANRSASREQKKWSQWWEIIHGHSHKHKVMHKLMKDKGTNKKKKTVFFCFLHPSTKWSPLRRAPSMNIVLKRFYVH